MDAWVLQADRTHRVEHAARLLEQETITWLGETRACVTTQAPLPEKRRHKLERRLGQPAELRLDCDVAWYPLGRGYVVLVIAPPAQRLEEVLDSLRPSYQEVNRSASPDVSVRVCMPKMAVADPLVMAEAIRAQGIDVTAVYEVGGCRR